MGITCLATTFLQFYGEIYRVLGALMSVLGMEGGIVSLKSRVLVHYLLVVLVEKLVIIAGKKIRGQFKR
jgi:hypothetical protein